LESITTGEACQTSVALSRKTTSPVWKHVIQVLNAKDFTHVCHYPDAEGNPCDARITVYKSHGSFCTTKPLKHFAKVHKDSSIARSVAAREEDSSGEKSLAMADLLRLNPGAAYKRFEKDGAYGWIPSMALCSDGQLGVVNAESFSERVFSCAKKVLPEGRTLLSSEELEMVVLLHMKEAFMKCMCARRTLQSSRRSLAAQSCAEWVDVL
jgi:hypothetical protein